MACQLAHKFLPGIWLNPTIYVQSINIWPFLCPPPLFPSVLRPSPFPVCAMNIYSLALLPALLGLFVVSVGFLFVFAAYSPHLTPAPAANAHCAQMRISLTLLIFSLLSVLHACQLPRPLFTTVVSGAVITWLWRLLTCLPSLSLCVWVCVCVCMLSFSLCVSLHIFFVSPVCFFLLLLYVLHFSWLNNCSFHLQLPFVCTLSLFLCLLLLLLLFLLPLLSLWFLLLLLTMLWGHLNKFYCCQALSASDSDHSCPAVARAPTNKLTIISLVGMAQMTNERPKTFHAIY